MSKKQIKVVTWNNKTSMLPKGKTHFKHLIGPYYIARIGYLSLLNLEYCIFFFRPSGYKGDGGKILYHLLKQPYASNVVRTKTHSMKRGITSVLSRKMSLRILVKQMPKGNAINLPPHRYDYLLIAVCLIGPNGKILDINNRCQDALH